MRGPWWQPRIILVRQIGAQTRAAADGGGFPTMTARDIFLGIPLVLRHRFLVSSSAAPSFSSRDGSVAPKDLKVSGFTGISGSFSINRSWRRDRRCDCPGRRRSSRQRSGPRPDIDGFPATMSRQAT
jgi:hypothetical protein